jgi:sulfite reductase (NADPH) hemoprotein beta-component
MIEAAPALKLTKNEGLKEHNSTLAGTIAQSLNAGADHFSDDDYEFLKFHGVYQQDDRDKRKIGKQFIMMVRTKVPGGILSPAQYLVCDDLSAKYGNDTLRVTTRQTFQFHGILKSNLRQTIGNLNRALVSTLAACGDVERNIVAPPTPSTSPLVNTVSEYAKLLAAELAPKTPAYHSIWLEGKELDLQDPALANFVDPLYGKTYLPRKFKTALVIPPVNDVDIYTQDVGFIVIAEGDRLVGFNLLAGGGMGRSHGNEQTFPRLADTIGFIEPKDLVTMAKGVLTIHRDFGDRTNRKHARLKYVLEERGSDWFREELERRTGVKIQPARPVRFTTTGDELGWHQQLDGNYFFGLFVENGRIGDRGDYRLKSALRAVAQQVQPEVRLTPSQNVLLVNIKPDHRSEVDRIFAEYGVSNANGVSATRLASMSCPALPTCGLALAESERVMPDTVTRLEALLDEVGLTGEEIIVRMTGCPNGCARPYMAEIAFVGKAPNKYQIYLGGDVTGTRLNRLYKESVKGEDLMNELKPVLTRYARERQPGERLGDFCARTIWTEALATA